MSSTGQEAINQSIRQRLAESPQNVNNRIDARAALAGKRNFDLDQTLNQAVSVAGEGFQHGSATLAQWTGVQFTVSGPMMVTT